MAPVTPDEPDARALAGKASTPDAPADDATASSSTAARATTGHSPPLEEDILDSAAAGGMAIRGGVLRTITYVVAMLLSLASVPFMVRHLGADDYGRYVVASSVVFLIGAFTEAGLTTLATREYAILSAAERPRFMRQLIGLRMTLNVVGVLVAVALCAASGRMSDDVLIGVAIMGAALLFTMTQQTYAVALGAQLRYGVTSALELLKQATLSGTIVVLVLVGAGLHAFFMASLLSGVIVLVATIAVLSRSSIVAPAYDLPMWRRTLRDVLPFALAAAVGMLYFRVAVLAMDLFASSDETGYYGVAQRIIETLGSAPWLVVNTAFPILARSAHGDAERLRYGLGRVFDVSLLTGAAMCGGLIIGAPFVVDVIAGPGFQATIPVLQILAATLVTTFIFATWSYALLSLGHYRTMLVCNAVALVVAVALCPPLIARWGAEGGALATLLAEVALSAAYFVALRRLDPLLLPRVAPALRLLPGIGAMLAIGLLMPGPSLVVALAAVAAMLALSYACGAVPPEIRTALLRRDPGGGDRAR